MDQKNQNTRHTDENNIWDSTKNIIMNWAVN